MMSLISTLVKTANRFDRQGYKHLAFELDRIAVKIIRTFKKHQAWRKVASHDPRVQETLRADMWAALSPVYQEGFLSSRLKTSAFGDAMKGIWNSMFQGPRQGQKLQSEYEQTEDRVNRFLTEDLKKFFDAASFADPNRVEPVTSDEFKKQQGLDGIDMGALTPEQQQMITNHETKVDTYQKALKIYNLSVEKGLMPGDMQNIIHQLKNSVNSLAADLQGAATQDPNHPNFYFVPRMFQSIQALQNTLGSLPEGKAPETATLLKLLQSTHNGAVQGRQEATNDYQKASTGQTNDWQNIANYGPLTQLALMTAGERYWDPAKKKWTGLKSKQPPLQKLIEKYRDNRQVLEDVAKVYNTDVDTMLAENASATEGSATSAPGQMQDAAPA